MNRMSSLPRTSLSRKVNLGFQRVHIPLLTSTARRNVSSDTKPLVLEKPEKFNPPSHGAKLRIPKHRYYGPQMNAEELAKLKTKKYPNMMPPEGTFMYWFLHNKLIHLWLSLGILTTLATTVMVTNFKCDSPFADMLPEWYDLFLHPIKFGRTVIEIIKLDTARISAETAEKRRHRVDDVAKRAAYRKAQGLDQFEGIGGWTAKTDAQTLGPGMRVGDGSVMPVDSDLKLHQGKLSVNDERQEKRPLKKWFGIW